MTPIFHSFVCSVLLANHKPPYGVAPDRWRWRRLTAALHDPYRPELHYMRGPGPKWREANSLHGETSDPVL